MVIQKSTRLINLADSFRYTARIVIVRYDNSERDRKRGGAYFTDKVVVTKISFVKRTGADRQFARYMCHLQDTNKESQETIFYICFYLNIPEQVVFSGIDFAMVRGKWVLLAHFKRLCHKNKPSEK